MPTVESGWFAASCVLLLLVVRGDKRGTAPVAHEEILQRAEQLHRTGRATAVPHLLGVSLCRDVRVNAEIFEIVLSEKKKWSIIHTTNVPIASGVA